MTMAGWEQISFPRFGVDFERRVGRYPTYSIESFIYETSNEVDNKWKAYLQIDG